jgi:carboxymethylenebutenolidase
MRPGSVVKPAVLTAPVTVNKEEASHHMGALDWGLAVKEIAQAAAFLKAEGSSKVGATGFCMGGALTLLGAATCPDIVCAAPFYGIPRDERVDLSKLDKPILVRH